MQLSYAGHTDNDMLTAYENVKERLEFERDHLNRLEQEIFRRIQERGGTSLPNADENGEQIWTCEQETKYEYDHSKFTPLKEMLNSTELYKCWTPERIVTEPVTVPAKWDTTKLKAVARRHSAEAVALVEAARVPTGRKLNFRRIERG